MLTDGSLLRKGILSAMEALQTPAMKCVEELNDLKDLCQTTLAPLAEVLEWQL